ncbi:nitroreductase [Acidovorax sp. SUPP3334]|uniref:nitroreductase n=1 Tax=Acidovorax sp. SUPP3334 TaxID=2920881 RepID=UPI0023DE31F9|nr:nitroreductase [Acidovorax sp. SUPP3334]GKT24615.1 nitroreductase [Acidovorax sp. SUPP3334]
MTPSPAHPTPLEHAARRGAAPSVTPAALQQAVDWAIVSRRSIRAFLPTPVPRETVLAILDVARHAASGMNTQPWRVHVLTGAAKARLSEAIAAVDDDADASAALTEPYHYYPLQWVSPFVDRRRKVGWDLYGLLGIAKGDKAAMHAQHGRNYRFFDAPVGLIFTVPRVMQAGSLMDYGMFLQSVMVAARARGLDTCPQVAFTKFHPVIGAALDIPDTEMVVCGMSLGHADPDRIENTLVTERESAESFTTFHA